MGANVGDALSILSEGLWITTPTTTIVRGATTYIPVYIDRVTGVETTADIDSIVAQLVFNNPNKARIVKGIIDGNILTPEFFADTDDTSSTVAGRKLGAMDARGMILEFCWLAPQIYKAETGKDNMTCVPSYRNEFIEMYKGMFDIDNPGDSFSSVISVSHTKRMPAPTRETNTPFDDTKDIKPRPRVVEKSEDSGGYVEILGQRFENILQFDCWARTNTEANELVSWLEAFMVRWEFWFVSLGIDKMFYYASGSDLSPTEAAAMSSWKQPLKLRTLEWYVRDEKLYYSDQFEIQAIVARILTEGTTRRLEYVI